MKKHQRLDSPSRSRLSPSVGGAGSLSSRSSSNLRLSLGAWAVRMARLRSAKSGRLEADGARSLSQRLSMFSFAVIALICWDAPRKMTGDGIERSPLLEERCNADVRSESRFRPELNSEVAASPPTGELFSGHSCVRLCENIFRVLVNTQWKLCILIGWTDSRNGKFEAAALLWLTWKTNLGKIIDHRQQRV